MQELVCDYCGTKRDEMMFVIGASKEKDWVMWEGTGKVSCPDCWDKGRQDSINAVDRHVNYVNRIAKNG